MAPLLPYRYAPYAYGILQAAITTAVATGIAIFPVAHSGGEFVGAGWSPDSSPGSPWCRWGSSRRPPFNAPSCASSKRIIRRIADASGFAFGSFLVSAAALDFASKGEQRFFHALAGDG